MRALDCHLEGYFKLKCAKSKFVDFYYLSFVSWSHPMLPTYQTKLFKRENVINWNKRIPNSGTENIEDTPEASRLVDEVLLKGGGRRRLPSNLKSHCGQPFFLSVGLPREQASLHQNKVQKRRKWW